MIEAIQDPGEERMHSKEIPFLGELVKLWVPVEEAGGDELVEDAQDEGGHEREDDVVEGEGPGFEDDLAGKAVLEGILDRRISSEDLDVGYLAGGHTQNCVMKSTTFL